MSGFLSAFAGVVIAAVDWHRQLVAADYYHPVIMFSTVLTANIAARHRRSQMDYTKQSTVFYLMWSYVAYGFGGSMMADYLLFVR